MTALKRTKQKWKKKNTAVTRQKRKYDFTSLPREQVEQVISDSRHITAEKCKRNFSIFIETFWECISADELSWNWHIDYLCQELEKLARRVAEGLPRENDLIINIPPGTTKSTICTIMFPVWCWINWHWMRFIASSYSGQLAMEHAEISRDLVKTDKFQLLFPELSIKKGKDTKSNFRIVKETEDGSTAIGGSRFSTSVGGTLTGFHGHILLVDDPVDPNRAISEVELNTANNWIDQTLTTRKIDKAVTPTVLIMQRLHQNDPTGHLLKKKKNIFHICIPGEIKNYRDKVKPVELIDKYVDGLLDPERMNDTVLQDLEAGLGQYGYAGQVGQDPTPPGGGMFKVDHFQTIDTMPSSNNIIYSLRYWDKAGTEGGTGAYTVGAKLHRLRNGKFLVSDIKRGRWSSEERERIIRETAEADGRNVLIYYEQEGGSGGKESAEATARNLAGFSAYADKPVGDKAFRADPFSVQVNNGNVLLLRADWNYEFIEEFRFFPFSTYKDQVDAASGAFNKLAAKKKAGTLLR